MIAKDNCARGRGNGCGVCAGRTDACGQREMQGAQGGICGPSAAQGAHRGCRAGQGARWMRRLQVIDFALQELVLYLDVYPDCRRALAHYHKLCGEREQLVKIMQANGMPICATGNDNRDRWEWIDSPWPWEFDFVGNQKD